MTRLLLLLAFVTITGDLAAKEVPSEYTNLQVLPRDISRREIVSSTKRTTIAIPPWAFTEAFWRRTRAFSSTTATPVGLRDESRRSGADPGGREDASLVHQRASVR